MMGAAAADFDNDGFPDLFVAGVGRNILYRNLGNGTFRDVTADARVSSPHPKYGPMWGIHGAWLDFDRRWLARPVHRQLLRLGSRPASRTAARKGQDCARTAIRDITRRFRINCSGTIATELSSDVSIDSGVARHLGKGMGAAVGDVDEDGWPDVFVANDTEPNFCFAIAVTARSKTSLQRGVWLSISSARPCRRWARICATSTTTGASICS